jgi:hypothetical protein
VFFKTEDQLVSSDTDGRPDVYEHVNGQTRLVSTGSVYGEGPDAYLLGCSADGSRAFFALYSGAIYYGAFVRINGSSTETVFLNTSGGFQPGSKVAFSSDGTVAAFDTLGALDGTDVDDDTGFDVYRWSGGTTTLVSTGAGDADDSNALAAISGDGTRIYMNARQQFSGADVNSTDDVYVGAGGAPALLSFDNAAAAGASQYLNSTPDGSRVFFRTTTAIDGSDGNGELDAYMRNAGTTTWISEPDGGTSTGTGLPDVLAVSPAAERIYFSSSAPLTSDDAGGGTDVFLRTAAGLRNVSREIAGGPGQVLAACNELSVVRSCASTDATRFFLSTDERLAAKDTDSAFDIYRFTAPNGPTELVSDLARDPGDGTHFLGGVSTDGSRALFDSSEKLACRDGDNGGSDVYEWSNGAVGIMSPQVGTGDQGNVFATISADGSQVFFASNARYAGSDSDGNLMDMFAARPGGSDSGGCISAAAVPPKPPQCSDGIDNDGDGTADRNDPGCLSGGAYKGTDNDESNEGVADLVLCGRRDISLIRADRKGGRVTLSGVVASRLIASKVTLTVTYGGKTRKLATVKPASDGQFKAKVKGPPRRQRSKARYRATAGGKRSVALKLPQSLASTSVKVSGGQVTLRGQVTRSLLGKRKPITIRRLVCGKLTKTATTRANKRGAYVARFKAPPLATAALYRAESQVLKRPRSKRYARQFARAIVVLFQRPTG